MTLAPGTRIGPYEINAQIGVGGMGEVYRASDTNLKRQVAIKVLPTSVAGDAERLVRFQREAEILAALNHPNIAQIHGLERSDGTIALVMELVEGPTLADVIERYTGSRDSSGSRAGLQPRQGLPLDETLAIARQITAALERAHEQGIVHRDLKPANIKVRPDGTVKVLDFGLAKAMESHAVGRGFSPAGDAGSKDPAYMPLSQAPTITSPALMTGAGMILGTAAYMSPEQAKGRPADRRSDMWSFGCVLYEMLTGRRLFDGDDMSEVMADVIKGQVSFDTLPANTPPGLRRLLQRCLRKDPAQRLDSAAAARIELDELGGADAADTPGVNHSVNRGVDRRSVGVLAGAVVLSATMAAAATWLMFRDAQMSAPAAVTRFEINPPPGLGFPGANLIPRFAVSPDGRSVAVEAGPPGVGPFHLWVRRFDQIEGRPLQGTAAAVEVGVQGPFWFPNGEMVGFFDESAHQLKTVSLLNDQVRTLADVPGNQYGGAANRDGVIIFSSIASSGIMRVPASGGTPQQVTTLAQGEVAHLWPAFLPDGNHFLYLALTENRRDWAVFLGSLDGQPSRRLVEADSMAQLAAPDRLLFVRGDSLFAQRLDVSTNQLVGDPLLVAQPISVTAQGRAAFSVSASGTLVHASGAGQGAERDPTWVDRNGREEPMGLPRRRYSQVRLSPDGTKIALTVADIERDLWLWSFSAKTLTRLTSSAGAGAPAWTPDSKRIAYSSGSTVGASTLGLFMASADGSAKPDKLAPNGTPSSIMADGTALLMDGADQSTAGYTDVYRLPLVGSRERQLLLGGPLGQSKASVSPDGRWMAYQGGESGRVEIVVRPFPAIDSGQWQVSTMGGTQPVWSRDGRELFYVSLDSTLMSVTVGSGPAWTGGTPTPLFSSTNLFTGLVAFNTARATYDVAADGRFLILKAAATAERPLSASLVVVTNWQQELAPAVVK